MPIFKKRIMKTQNILIICATLLIFAVFFWPTFFRYDHMKFGNQTIPVRINRITGEIKILYPGSASTKPKTSTKEEKRSVSERLLRKAVEFYRTQYPESLAWLDSSVQDIGLSHIEDLLSAPDSVRENYFSKIDAMQAWSSLPLGVKLTRTISMVIQEDILKDHDSNMRVHLKDFIQYLEQKNPEYLAISDSLAQEIGLDGAKNLPEAPDDVLRKFVIKTDQWFNETLVQELSKKKN